MLWLSPDRLSLSGPRQRRAIAGARFACRSFPPDPNQARHIEAATVDTGNSVLLLVGIRLAQRKATATHPFGHGKEPYFWSLIVAVLIFGVGGGMSAYEGVLHILRPSSLEDPFWSYVVATTAAAFEGASFTVGLRGSSASTSR